MYLDYLELLQCLNDNKVKYLIIGGYAVIHYAEPRYTKDLDIWIEASSRNAKNTLKALSTFGAPIANLTEEELATPGLVYIFGIPPVRVDVINHIKGADFKEIWANKNKITIGKVTTQIVSKKDLIKLKKIAGRPQDKADIAALSKK